MQLEIAMQMQIHEKVVKQHCYIELFIVLSFDHWKPATILKLTVNKVEAVKLVLFSTCVCTPHTK